MNSMSLTQCAIVTCLACAAFCFGYTAPRVPRNWFRHLSGAIFMIPFFAILALMALCACIGAFIGLGIVVSRASKARAAATYCRSLGFAGDLRSAKQRRAGAAIEMRFAAIRLERGVDKFGRLKRAPRSAPQPSALPYASPKVVDIFGHPSRKQAG